MTNTVTAPRKMTDNFTQVYNFTLSKLRHSEQHSTDIVLHILHLLLESEQHVAVHALELWLFCEARKISLSTEDAALKRKAIQENIVQRFVAQSDTELDANKVTEIEELMQTVLQKMGFQFD